MPATVRQVVDRALQIIGQVAGSGVQQYSEDIIRADAISGFDMLFKKRYWDPYTLWFRVELDGTTGVPTTNAFTQVSTFEDFAAVHKDGSDVPLPLLSHQTNTYAISSGTTPQFWGSLEVTHANYAGRKIKVYPVTSTGFINVRARVYPLVPPTVQFGWNDNWYLDKELLAQAAALQTLSRDDLNPSHAETVRQFLDMRYKDIVKALADKPRKVRSHYTTQDQWWTP